VPTSDLNELANAALALAEDITGFGIKVLLTGAPEAIVSADPPGLRPVPKPPDPSQAPNQAPPGKKERPRKLSSAQKRALREKGDAPL